MKRRFVDIRQAVAAAEQQGASFEVGASRRIGHFSQLHLRVIRAWGNGIDWGLSLAQYPDILEQIRKHIMARSPEETAKRAPPVPMLLTCPSCGERHIDEGDFADKEHHTHACQHCGMCWRPAVVATVGVQFLPGFKNEEDDDE